MSLYAPIIVTCDLPKLVGQHTYTCSCRLNTRRSKKADAMSEARRLGWLNLAGYDFCGRPDEADADRAGWHNHAAIMGKHRPRITQTIDRATLSLRDTQTQGTWSVRCSCRWKLSAETVNPIVMENGLVGGKTGAAKVWLESHILVDVQGIPAKWQPADVKRHHQQMRDFFDRLDGDRSYRDDG